MISTRHNSVYRRSRTAVKALLPGGFRFLPVRTTGFLRTCRTVHAFTLLLVLALLTACGTDGSHFKLEGRLLHLGGGEFYVYSPDGELQGIDTIKIQAGRFTYEMPCTRPQTLMIVFPNYTEQPVFAQPGKSVSIEGDASHLKEMKVSGTKDNKLMDGFRKQVAQCSPPEAVQRARTLRRYFLQMPDADLKEAARLTAALTAAQPDNGSLKRIQQRLAMLGTVRAGSAVPAVGSTRALDGTVIDRAWLTRAPATFVCAWASWNYASMSYLRQAADVAQQSGGRLQVLGICLDASPAEARQALRGQNITCVSVCDGRMTACPLFRALGLYDIPDNVLVRQGRIAALHLPADQLSARLKAESGQ